MDDRGMARGMREVSRWVRWLVAAAVVAMAVQGCGGGRDEVTSSGAIKAAPTPAVAADVTGTYWDPFQPGSGLFFEAQGGTGVATLYLFEPDGRSVWYSAIGTFKSAGTGHEFTGTLQRFTGGQAAASPTPRTPQSAPAGPLTIQFAAGGLARVQLPARTIDVVKLARSAQLPAVPPADQPPIQLEAGIYWNPEESGRGYTVEVINGYVSVGVFHYDAQGAPMWHLVAAPVARDGRVRGEFVSYRDGQSLAGAYKPSTRGPVDGTLELRTRTACTAQLALPGRPLVNLQRFSFDASAQPCRAGRIDSLPAMPEIGELAIERAGISWQKYLSGWVGTFQEMPPVSAMVSGLPAGKARFSVASGALPQGVRVDPDTGVISGVPLQHGEWTGQIGLEIEGYKGRLTADFLLPVKPVRVLVRGGENAWDPNVVWVNAASPVPPDTGFYVSDGIAFVPARFAAGTRVVFSIDPAFPFPPGLHLDPSTGLISGMPWPAFNQGTRYRVLVDIQRDDVAVQYAQTGYFARRTDPTAPAPSLPPWGR